jgi:hypothetical protein
VVKGHALAPTLTGTFTDPHLPAGYAPSNVQNLNGVLYVTCARQDARNQPLSIDGLWALAPGKDGTGGSRQRLYFTAGPDGETHGLFGVPDQVPEAGTLAPLLTALAAFAGLRTAPCGWRIGGMGKAL